jgi:lysozyme family protein
MPPLTLSNADIIDIVLQFEGGFVDNANDRGGPTKYGITAATLGRYRSLGRIATRDEVAALSRDEAVKIYIKNYVTGPGFDAVPGSALRLAMVDSGVLFGPARPVAWLRICLGLHPTPRPVSQLGADLLAQLPDAATSDALAVPLLVQRLRSATDICGKNPPQMVFLRGWVNRVATILAKVG